MRQAPDGLDGASLEVLARNTATRLKKETGPNQDLLSDLCEGKSFEDLARLHTSGNIGTLQGRLVLLFGEDHLNLSFPPRSSEARQIIDRAFDLMDEGLA
ncbi:MAG TPA: hypothetical protein VNU25_02925 [Candidatus Paceibacterota bacterium]|nr:hypothetical protein [Candidatus Paceibacterota bacterium]